MDSPLKITEVIKSVYHLRFASQEDMAYTMLRFQEHYESPKFRGEIFTLDQFKEWYTGHRGKWSYAEDWGGFNFPSRIVKPFIEGRFPELSDRECQLIDLVAGIPEPYYLIATADDSALATLRHEIAHGLYSTNADYRAEVYMLLEGCNLHAICSHLRAGYHPATWLDECHAYILSDFDDMLEEGLVDEDIREISEALNSAFDHYTEGRFKE